MTKKRKKEKRRVRISFILFTISLISWLLTSLYTKTQNASLTIKIQKMNDEIAELNSQNQTINIEINNLENKDRIYEVAKVSDMDQNQDNIVAIIGE